MALRKTGSRRLVVEGERYLWRVRRSPTYGQANCWHSLTSAVQHADGDGAVLVVTCDEPRPDNWLGRPGAVVTPRLVAQAIRRALAAGWRPLAAGPVFHLSEGGAGS
jgi:hypothetical protein